jgi:hypothetical protein
MEYRFAPIRAIATTVAETAIVSLATDTSITEGNSYAAGTLDGAAAGVGVNAFVSRFGTREVSNLARWASVGASVIGNFVVCTARYGNEGFPLVTSSIAAALTSFVGWRRA